MATKTWTGGNATDGAWTRSDNWSPSGAPAAGDDLIFDGSTRLTNNNDISADTSFNSITYAATAGAFVHSGNRITLAGAVSNDSANTQTIGFAIVTTAVRAVWCNTESIIISGIISGSGGGINKVGDYTLTLSGANSYTGATTVSHGTLVAGSNSAFGVGSAVTMNDDYTTIDITGYSVTIGSLACSYSVTVRVIVGNDPDTLAIGSDDTSPGAFAGVIEGAGSIIKIGTGTLELSNVNIFTGDVDVEGGNLLTTAPNSRFGAVGHAAYVTLINTSFITMGDNSANQAFGWAADGTPINITVNENSTLTTGADANTGGHLRPVALNGGTVVAVTDPGSPYASLAFDYGISTPGNSFTTSTISGSGTMSMSNPLQLDPTTINVGSGDTLNISLKINDAGNGLGLIKAGAGTLRLSGANTFVDDIDVNAGTLLQNGTSSSNGAVTVADTATLGGTGSLAGAISVSSGGKIAPGNGGTGIGTLGTEDVTFNSTSTYSVDLNGTTPTFDKINSSGTVALGAAANTLTVASIANSVYGKAYTIIGAVTNITGTFNGKAENSTFTVSGRTLRINYTSTTVILTDVTSGSWFLLAMKNNLYNALQNVNGMR